MQITNQFRMQVFGYNPNTKIEDLDSNRAIETEDIYYQEYIIKRLREVTGCIDIERLRLILKPLSQISDKDAIEVAKIIYPLPFQRHTNGWSISRDFTINGYPYIKIQNPKNVYSFQIDCALCAFDLYNMDENVTIETPMNNVHVIDYLRSKNYALPYLGVDLFEAGIAIEETVKQ